MKQFTIKKAEEANNHREDYEYFSKLTDTWKPVLFSDSIIRLNEYHYQFRLKEKVTA